jgi:hypothetical protein
MLSFIKTIFSHSCPACNLPLRSEHTPLGCVKECPEGHYSEESICHLGVRIVYDALK